MKKEIRNNKNSNKRIVFKEKIWWYVHQFDFGCRRKNDEILFTAMVKTTVLRKVLLRTAVVFAIILGSLANDLKPKNDRELRKFLYEYEGAFQ